MRYLEICVGSKYMYMIRILQFIRSPVEVVLLLHHSYVMKTQILNNGDKTIWPLMF